MKYKYSIVQRNDGLFAICELRFMEQSINIRQIYVGLTKKDCIEKLKKAR